MSNEQQCVVSLTNDIVEFFHPTAWNGGLHQSKNELGYFYNCETGKHCFIVPVMSQMVDWNQIDLPGVHLMERIGQTNSAFVVLTSGVVIIGYNCPLDLEFLPVRL